MNRIRQSSIQPAYSSSQAPKVFGEGRICSYPSCNTRLSRYNASTLCSLHVHEERSRRAI